MSLTEACFVAYATRRLFLTLRGIDARHCWIHVHVWLTATAGRDDGLLVENPNDPHS